MLAGSPKVGGVSLPLCDGCKLVLDNENKTWYRNMDIEENLNLCKECFFGKRETAVSTFIIYYNDFKKFP